MLPVTFLEVWFGQGGAVLREKTIQGGARQLCAPLVGSLTLAAAWSCLLEGAVHSHLGPLSGLGMTHQCDLYTSGIVNNWGGP